MIACFLLEFESVGQELRSGFAWSGDFLVGIDLICITSCHSLLFSCAVACVVAARLPSSSPFRRTKAMDTIEAQNAEAFFASAPPLKDQNVIVARVEEFVRRRLPTDVKGWSLASYHSQVEWCFLRYLFK